MTDVVIIGGGISGLAAAVDLARRGISGILIEQGPRLGGRCYSYVDKTTGDIVDNGQHVLLGAYHNLLRYLELIGTRAHLREQSGLRLKLHHPSDGFRTFSLAPLLPPFHLLAGMLGTNLLSLPDRLRLVKVGLFLKRGEETRLAGTSVSEWLTSLDQSPESQRSLWNPIAISVMNELPERASALLFARALRSAFLGPRADSAILLPTVGQSELYVDGALALLASSGFRVRMNTEVDAITLADGRASGVILRDGSFVPSRAVISAVPSAPLANLLPASVQREPPFSNLERLGSSPIISLHLWFDEEFMEDEFIGLIGSTVQWLFNRRRITPGGVGPKGYLSAVISAAHRTIDRPKEILVAAAVDDIHRAYPQSRSARLLSSVVIKEKRATFASTPDAELIRPPTRTPMKDLFLAGDWTGTGLPATIEGAAKSGFLAAEAVFTRRG